MGGPLATGNASPKGVERPGLPSLYSDSHASVSGIFALTTMYFGTGPRRQDQPVRDRDLYNLSPKNLFDLRVDHHRQS